ncbi:hypothetical protein E1I69_08785 [Bacillus timonensis]|uniref:Uncharacterized protein n=1 Tax=Bacillus timonensis TaxID=1033734 RepID=A0A4S3PUL7_9BACI|nr:TnsD family Tn7-like transposition protein [Bacillus timonensis]THE13184.1 hypothetical protein E1I69_08785 [Bacillus timonensis]
MMIPFFPSPYPDETLYSIIARYHLYSGNLSYKHTILDLFGKKTRTNWYLPSNINALVQNIQITTLTADYIIDKHTLFPFFSSFLSNEKKSANRQNIIDGEGQNIYSDYGLIGSSIKATKPLTHCNLCMQEDIDRYGETYWHRVHQLPGVYVCPIHRIPLLTSLKQIESSIQYQFILPGEDIFDNTLGRDYNQEIIEQLYEYAVQANWLLNQFEIDINSNFREKYSYFLEKNKFNIRKGVVNQDKWKNAFRQFYHPEVLEMLNVATDFTKEHCWVSKIVRTGNQITHPMQHILAIMVLCRNLADFFLINLTVDKEDDPFGTGPWPCLNPAHKLYMQDVIETITISKCKKTKNLIGKFQCSCGFIYTRVGPDSSTLDKYKISRKMDFGYVWKEELKKLVEKGDSRTEIAKKLQVTPDTITRYAVLLKLNHCWSGRLIEKAELDAKKLNDTPKRGGTLENIQDKRQQWLEILKQNLNKKRNDLIRENLSIYRWLNKYDKVWLSEHLPKRQKYKGRSPIDSEEEKRDQKLLQIVKIIIENWSQYELSRPKKISKTFIMEKIREPGFIKADLERYPCTRNYINSVIESSEKFYKRKISRAIDELISAGEPLFISRILNKAGCTGEKYQYAKKVAEELL